MRLLRLHIELCVISPIGLGWRPQSVTVIPLREIESVWTSHVFIKTFKVLIRINTFMLDDVRPEIEEHSKGFRKINGN